MADARKAPKDDGAAPEAPPGEVPPLLSLAELFGREMEEEEHAPPMVVPPSVSLVRRAPRAVPIPDLRGKAPLWALIGPGNGGKTFFARYIAGELLARKMSRFVLAALDPGPRLLAEFRMKVMVPPSTDAAETAAWLRQFVAFVEKQRAPGVLDTGGGDTSFGSLIRSAPTVDKSLRDAGVALIPAYFLARPDDPAILEAHAATGFRPDAVALVLNMNSVDGSSGFDAVRAHPAYKAALARGAVEIVLPKLEPLRLSQRIEARRFHFHEARDGIVPEGSPARPIESGLERAAVRELLEALAREVQPLEAAGWMPWA